MSDATRAWWIAFVIAALFFGAGWASHAGHYALAIIALTFASAGIAGGAIVVWLFYP